MRPSRFDPKKSAWRKWSFHKGTATARGGSCGRRGLSNLGYDALTTRLLERRSSVSSAIRLNPEYPDAQDRAQHGQAADRPTCHVNRTIRRRLVHHRIVPMSHDCLLNSLRTMATVAFGFQSRCPKRENVCGVLWRRSNNSLVPWSGTAHFNLHQAVFGLSSANRGWVGFLKHSIFEPGDRRARMLCGFFSAVSLALEKCVPETTKDQCCEDGAYYQLISNSRTDGPGSACRASVGVSMNMPCFLIGMISR